MAGLPINQSVAENLFAAIQADTGSFRYANTTPSCLRVASEMVSMGADPWEVSRKVVFGSSVSRLKLLEMALGTLELHCGGKIGIMTITAEMIDRAKAHAAEMERFVDYPRFVSGVEIAVLIRQRHDRRFKFSLRSNDRVNVAELAGRFGGGGHSNAAGFEDSGSLSVLKERFLKEAVCFFDGT
jgi:phosphoesterase RecJ-like protein